MTTFSNDVLEFWRKPFIGDLAYSSSDLSLVVNADLDDDKRIILLWTESDDHTAVAVQPEIAKTLTPSLTTRASPNVNQLRDAISEQGFVLHDADNVYYLPHEDFKDLLAEPVPSDIRTLGPNDAQRFAQFQQRVTEQDLDGAQVDLDDWAVLGVLDTDGQILCAGSMYPWGEESLLADTGVLTRTDVRGQGHARRLVRAMYRHAISAGYEPQYRCQLDNTASIALAASSGMSLFGRWEVVTPDEDTRS